MSGLFATRRKKDNFETLNHGLGTGQPYEAAQVYHGLSLARLFHGRSLRSPQEAGRTYRLAILMPFPREAPPILFLLDELRRRGIALALESVG